MKQGKTEKAVFAKLSTQKVELAIISSTQKEVDKIYDDLQRVQGIMSNVGNNTESISKSALTKVNYSLEQIDLAEKMAEELGVSSPKISELKKSLLGAEKIAKEYLKKSIEFGKI
jgi:hypothetical protein